MSKTKYTPEFWLNHPDERIRMLRYWVRQQLPPETKIAPKYSEKPKIGVVISTHGSIPYLDLNLHYLLKVNKIPVLIHDDCSGCETEFNELLDRYDRSFDVFITHKRLWHKTRVGTFGDTNSFFVGLQWAKMKKLDILVKLSRRLVCVSEFVPKLQKLAMESDAFTFGRFCYRDDFPLRTECVALNVNAWGGNYALNQLKTVIDLQFPIYAEFWFHDVAKILAHANSSEKYREYAYNHNLGANFIGFAEWCDLLGTTRYDKSPGALWHIPNKVEEYVAAAREVFGDRYSLKDFKNFENF